MRSRLRQLHTCFDHRWGAVLAFVVAGFFSISAYAQQPQERPTVLDHLRRTADQEFFQEQRRSLRRMMEQRRAGSAPLSKANLSDLGVREAQVTLNEQDWPRDDLNFFPGDVARRAGDVNGDGVNDWIYKYNGVADDRSSDPSRRTDKTLLVYGGRDISARYYDELYYQDLRPVGTFLGDDNRADAIRFIKGGVQAYAGTQNGYVEEGIVSGVEEGNIGGRGILSFFDVDGDGYDDILIGNSGSTEFTIVFGAASLEDVTTKTYSPARTIGVFPRFTYATGDVNGDDQAEIIRLEGGPQTRIGGLVLGVDENRALTFVQESFEPLRADGSSLPTEVTGANLVARTFDINGSGTPELLLTDTQGSFPETLVYAVDQGAYQETAADGFPGEVAGVGDLNDDGRADFAFPTEGASSGTIGFGPQTLGNGLTQGPTFGEDAESVEYAFSRFDASPGPLGDVTGDGRDDLIVEVSLTDQFGPRLVEVASDGSLTETDGPLFTRSEYQGDDIRETAAIGDWNGDGSEDFALLRERFDAEGLRRGEVEIYFDAPEAGASPDLTLEHPENFNPESVTTGDFTGNGDLNLAVSWNAQQPTVAIYEAGDGSSPIHTINFGDLSDGIETEIQDFYPTPVENVGDVNNDSVDDLLVSASQSSASTSAFLYLGGSSLSTQPDEVVNLDGLLYAGSSIQRLGDINDDGIDDFVVGVGSGFQTGAYVYYGQDGTPDFSEPDLNITPNPGSNENLSIFPLSVAVGDFNGDGNPDLAASPAFHENTNTGEGLEGIRIYHGGPSFDGTPERKLFIPAPPLGGSGENLNASLGELQGLSDVTGDGSDDLLVGTYEGGGNNALVYAGNGSQAPAPSFVLRAPDQSAFAGLGPSNNRINFNNRTSAVGDFGDGTVTALLPQQGSSLRGDPVYGFSLTGDGDGETEEPVASSSQSVDASNEAGQTVDFGDTGTSVTFSDQTSGSGDVTVDRFRSAPDGVAGIEGNASEYRVEITAGGDLSVGNGTEVRFDVSQLEGVSDPGAVTVYTRELSGLGSFEAVETSYDEQNDQLVATVSGFSEFAFGSETEPLFSYPDQVSVNASRSFGDASGPGDYRLVALPGQVDRSLSSVLDGSVGTQWQAYWDDGSSFVKYDGSNTFVLQAGNGFWVTSTQDLSVSEDLPSVSLSDNQATTVPLNGESEWTIVSNPFDRTVRWSEVRRATGLSAPLWTYDADDGFIQADEMKSAATGTAYYVFNGAGADELTIPYPATSKNNEVASTTEEDAPALAISARPASGDGPPSTVRVGLGEKKTHAAPPGRFEPASLRLTPPSNDRALMMARRPAEDGSGGGEGQTFALRLTSRVDGPVEIEAEDLGKSGSESAALLRPETGESYDLRRQETVTIGPEGETVELKVAVGSAQYVEGRAEQVVPQKVSLTSYPNPIQRQGTLEYALPEAREVTLEVYDVLGRQVATLEQGRKKAGRHTARLETSRLSSGVYFGRLEAGGETRTQKITVVH